MHYSYYNKGSPYYIVILHSRVQIQHCQYQDAGIIIEGWAFTASCLA